MLAALLFGAAAHAALAADMALAPSPALACLTLPAGAAARPEYPPEALERKEGGEVRVQLVFRYPDQKPDVKILHSTDVDQLDDVVKKHVLQYRVPCMKPGDGPVTLLQEYAFDPDGRSRVMASAPRDEADIARAAQMKCLRHEIAGSKPTYPQEALRRDEQGTLLAKMHFTAPDKPPALDWVAASPHKSLSRSVERYAEGLTLPCLDDGPVDIIIAYQFVIDGGARTVFKDTNLVTLLGASKDLAKPAFFDLNTMSCPFDVRVSYHRPFADNSVQQLDTLNPARQPLLDWLAGLTMNLKQAEQLRLYGNKMIVRIPCGKIDL
jgi:hypothetical protein